MSSKPEAQGLNNESSNENNGGYSANVTHQNQTKRTHIIRNYKLRTSLESFTNKRERSFQTHHGRKQVLNRAIQDIFEGGYKIYDVDQLKLKHIQYLLDQWQAKGISTAEIKNRMSHLRWLAVKVGKPMMIPQSNKDLGIEERKMPANDINRAISRTTEDLAKIKDPCIQMSLKAQELFGLRRKESILFYPKRDYDAQQQILNIEIGTKGGRPRVVPVLTEAQRSFLKEAMQFQKDRGIKAFIDKDKDGNDRNYKKQMNLYKSQCEDAGLYNNHGLRHHYAQTRYLDLTGWQCPRKGGKTYQQMTDHEKSIDEKARLIVSEELGHGREYVTRVYLGR